MHLMCSTPHVNSILDVNSMPDMDNTPDVCRYGQTVAAGQDGDIMFVPQRPYMVLGSLREQVLYPTWATSSALTSNNDAEDAQSAASRQVCRPVVGTAELRPGGNTLLAVLLGTLVYTQLVHT